ncbi:anti-sigma factor [Opitutus sp. GAS368]|jgi:anti-sigma-K factor RskA|uniref:anti-sigma factor n=1 Tax=Opitutus sp. GAS368 TaxID=1882749 RepID=UPI0008793532|nr:anti-sigma factor [Opitutus sp. GAS368]SDS51757.1 Anti-sigma-K factor RskA [Opitutus sp. GAS368]
MITERHEELAALHALGLLEGAERSAFESELAGNTDLRALADSLAESTAALALAAPPVEPPAGLKDRILAAAGEPAGGQVIAFPLLRFAPWAVAAALAVAATWLFTQNLALRDENTALTTERQLAEVAYKLAQTQLSQRSLLAETMITELGNRLRRAEDLSRLKISALASLAGNTKEAQVIAVWDPGQQAGLLTMEKLPAIADTQDYQIWIVDPAYKDPVNGGVFHVAADGKVTLAFKPDQPVAQAAAFAISLEKKGGVPKAEGTIVLLGK